MTDGVDRSLLRRAQELLRQRQFAEAESAFRHLARSDDGEAAWLGLVAALAGLGRDAEAVTIQRHLCALDPRRADHWDRLGRFYGRLGHVFSSAVAFGRALARSPRNFHVAKELARAQLALGQAGSAQRALTVAVEVHGWSLELAAIAACIAAERDDPEATVAPLRQRYAESDDLEPAAVTVLQFAGHRRRLGPLRAIAEFLFEAKRQTGGGAARIAHEFLFLLHGAFTARQTADAIADLLPQLMAIPEVQEDLAFVMHQIGDSFGAEAAFARAAHWQHESIARHPMAGSGLRFLQPRWLITSLGETASRLNYFVKSGLLEFREQISPVLLAPPEEIAHRHFLRQFRPWIAVVEAPEEIEKFRPLAAELGYDVGTIIFKNGRAMHNAVVEQIVEAEWHRRRLPPLLSCDAEDESAGREALRRWGLGAEDWFVALHVRAPGYHGESDDRRGRDIGIRNADIATYEMAIRRITSRGGWVIRIGDPSMPKLPAMHRVVDYAHSADRHPSIDMFLFAAARLFIGTNSGPAQVAYCFNQRLLLTNWHPFSMPPPSPHYMWLPRFYVDARNGEPLALRRCLTPPLRRLARGSALDEYGVRLVDNAPEEIAESVDAMLAWIETGTPPKSAMELRMDAIFAETGNLHSARMAPPALRRYAGELAG